MKLTSLRSLSNIGVPIEDSLRTSFYVPLHDVVFQGRNHHYPNCLLDCKQGLVNPYDERVMSLQRDSFYDNDEWKEYSEVEPVGTIKTPHFFFVYNVDNYFHFIYDTLPILSTYFKLKEQEPTLKLLLNTSHPSKQTLSPFVNEFLAQLGITEWSTPHPGSKYKTLYVSTSFTHGGQSNTMPSFDAYCLWKRFPVLKSNGPKRFYISRRSWVHGKTENMGTNYTMRRKCENEDALVEMLAKYNIQEVFTELLTTDEKLALFQNAELVVGIVGGGMCNLLFSPSTTKALCINTPYFLDINQRFQYSMNHTTLVISQCSSHVPSPGAFRLYSRVRVTEPSHKFSGCVGEVEGFPENGSVLVSLSSNDIAGFSQDFPLRKVAIAEKDLVAVDKGLNSPFICDISELETLVKNLLK
jgi:hypothetical protein